MLRHDLSDTEIAETARKLSTKVEDRASLEEEKKNVASSYKNRIDILDNEINQSSRLISCGYEMRMTECHVFFDDPENGHKRIVRTDTGETLRIEKMAQHEMQKELPLEEAADVADEELEEDDSDSNDPKSDEAIEEAILKANEACEIWGQVFTCYNSGTNKAKLDKHTASCTAGEKQAAQAAIAKAHPHAEITELVDTGETETIREGGPEWTVWNYAVRVA